MLGKRGRRGGARRGGVKRSLPPPAPPPSSLRPAAAAAAGTRLPIAASAAARKRNRPGTVSPAPAPLEWEETFSLQPGDPNFAAIIRLTPDVVEEIRRVEAEGGTARIKFDPSSNNVSGNVIDICGKEFRFTWSREFGDLCDIYEERPKGSGGHGLLIESGSAWRKINVERVLDESTKNHVKMRSVEAERLSKSRKAIVLDPANPSVKNQVKSMAAAGLEGIMRRTSLKQKKEPQLKKRKFEPTRGILKMDLKSGASSKSTGEIRLSTSPSVSPHHQQGHGKFDSPFGASNYSNPEVRSTSVNINKENIGSLKKDIHVALHGTKHESNGQKCVIGDQSMDLRSILVNLLSENPKGMTIKALEETVGEAIPISAEKIESAVKNIATFTALGRYILKPGVELESSKRLVSEKDSSTESVDDHTTAAKSTTLEKATADKYGEKTQLNFQVQEHSDPFENIEADKHEHPCTSDRKAYFSEGRGCIPSGSGSDSKGGSDADGGSDIGTGSRRRNAGSGSPSSSDSESDSSSWNDGSDEEVDITAGNDQKDGEQKREATKLKLPSSTGTAYNDVSGPITISANNLEGNESLPPLILNAYEATEESPINNNTVNSKISKSETSKCPGMYQYQRNSMLPDRPSHDQYKQSENKHTSPVKKTFGAYKQVVNQSSNEKQTMVKDGHVHQHTEVPEISKSKLRRGSLKTFENSTIAVDDANISISKGRLAASAHELSTESPTNLMTGVQSNQDVFNRRLPTEVSVDQTPHSAPLQSRQLSRVNHAENEALSLSDKSAETTGRKEKKMELGNYIGSHKEMPASIRPQNGNNNGGRTGSKIVDGTKIQQSATLLHCRNQHNNDALIENHNIDRDRPELQDRIKDFPEWRECVNDYHEKYELYFALMKNLENTMDKFIKVSNDLEVAKGRNKKEYGMLAEKLKEMYHECGERHKQMKKTFIFLHDELKCLKQRIKDYVTKE